MTGEDDLFLRKHLARNVPLDFMACCERVRIRLATDGHRHRRPDDGRRPLQADEGHRHSYAGLKLERVFPGIAQTVCSTELTAEAEERVLLGLVEIEVRYVALCKTLDHSVPAAPIYQNLRMLRGRLRSAAESLNDPDRDAAVRFVSGLPEEEPIPAGIDAFRTSRSIAERAARANSTLNAMAKDIDEMIDYFDYKYGLVTRGNPSKFGLMYAVNALAALFEDESDRGLKAVVSETFTDARHRTPNARRYYGEFLNFVTNFVRAVDPQQMTPNRDIDEGFQDRVRKMAQARRKNPDLFKLLHGIVTVDVMLDFMRQTEAIK